MQQPPLGVCLGISSAAGPLLLYVILAMLMYACTVVFKTMLM